VNALLLTLPAVALAAAGPGPADDPAKKDLANLEGSWSVVRGEEDGQPCSAYLVEHLKLEFQGGRLTFKDIAPLTDKASRLAVTLDPTTDPRCIDLTVEVGSLKGDVFEGAYKLTGDELTLCLHLGKGNRPVEFTTKDGSNRVLLVLKRDKP
jgi:uncharacterized protein (TIGR03067 family)